MNQAVSSTILIVDGDPASRILMSDTFRRTYRVLEAESCTNALAMLCSGEPVDIVLLDIDAPNASDYAAMKRMRKKRTMLRIPVVVLAAHDDAAAQRRAFQLGAVDVILKPFVPELLFFRVENILSPIKETYLSEETKWRAELLRMTRLDPKTGLWNRETFCHETQKHLLAHPGERFVIVRWDIDNFKVFNDMLGVTAGDLLLSSIGEAYRAAPAGAGLHSGLPYGHWDADHFVSLWAADQLDAQQLYELTLQQLNLACPNYNFSIRIGLYLIETLSIDVGVMCDRALLALNSIKGSYGKHFAWYDTSMRLAVVEEQALASAMKQALFNGEFIVYYQPQYNYDSRALIGAEALVRWLHPVRGLISPGQFIPLFERNGFICELDRYVWEQVCRQIRNWLDRGISVPPISVNVSRRDLDLPNLAECFQLLVEQYRLEPDMLRLEITECAYADNPALLTRIVSELQQRGFFVEMDDFGSGYSSLNTLKDVPVDMLKLDMKFLSEKAVGRRGESILAAVVRMAHSIHLPVIAEGVETRQQAEYLISVSCFYMQGCYFSEPLPADIFEARLREAPSGTADELRFRDNEDDALALLDTSAQSALLFNSYLGGAAILEYERGNLATARINDNYLKELGVTRDAYRVWQYHLQDRLPPEQRAVFFDMLKSAIRTGGEADCTVCTEPLTEGGEAVWMRCRVRYLANRAGCHVFFHCIENVTEQKRLEARCQALSSQLAALVQCLPDGSGTNRLLREGSRSGTPDSEDALQREKRKAVQFAGVYSAIRSIYPRVISINLTQNRFECLTAGTLSAQLQTMDGKLDQLWAHDAAAVPAADRAAFQVIFSREGLLGAFARGEDAVRLEHPQHDAGGVCHWMETVILRVDNPYDNDVLGVLLSRPIDNRKEAETALKANLAATSGELAQRLSFHALIDRFSPEMIILRYQTQQIPPFIMGNLSMQLGYTHEEVLSAMECGISSAVYAEDLPLVHEKRQEIAASHPEQYSLEYRIKKKDGTLIWISAQGARFVDSDGQSGYVTTYLDTTERHNLIDRLRASQQSYRLMVENSDRLIYTYNIPTKTAFFPERMQALLGLPAVVENLPDRVTTTADIAPGSLSTYLEFYHSIQSGHPCDREWLFERRLSADATIWLKAHYFLALGAEGNPVTATVYMDDVTALKRKEEDLINRAQRDGMTGLYNRATAEAHIRELLSRDGPPCALLVLDLDDLKNINDTLGHAQGDRALRAIGNLLFSHFRSRDILGRLGGDEFLIFLPAALGEDVLHGALSALLRKLSSVCIGGNDEYSMHCSIGAVWGTPGVDHFDALYKKADTALYHVKRNGKNDYAFYRPEMDSENYCYTGHTALALHDSATMDWSELHKLVGASADRCPLIFSANLSQNRYTLLAAEPRVTALACSSETLDAFAAGALQFLHPDTQQMAKEVLSRSALLTAYRRGESRVGFHGQWLDAQTQAFVPCEFSAIFFTNGNGDVCDLTFVRPQRPGKSPTLQEKVSG